MVTTAKARLSLGAGALVLYLLSFHGLGPLCLLAPGLLLRSLDGLKLPWQLLFSALWGVVFAGLFNLWAFDVSPAIWCALVVVRGLPWALLCLPQALADRVSKHSLAKVLAGGVGWALVCWVLLLGPTGYDWENPIAAFASWPWCLSTLPWLGLPGTALVIATASRAVFTFKRVPAMTGLALLGLWLLLSAQLYRGRQPDAVVSRVPLALLQTGWPESEKWAEKNRLPAIERLVRLTREAQGKGARLIVWPETAWPYYNLRQDREAVRALSTLARELQSDLLVTSIEERDGGWYNTVSQVTATGRFGFEYRKRRLLPFAEYLPLSPPWSSLLPTLGPFAETCRYLPGTENPVLEHADLKYALLICYESMIPATTADRASEVDFFVIVTNDALVKGGFPKEAHFRSAILRAAEFRKPFFQAGNEGVTGVIDRYGKVLQRTPTEATGPQVLMHSLDTPGIVH